MILVIQNGYYPTYISKYINEEIIIIKSYEENVSLLNIEQYSIIIILGANYNISDGISEILNNVIDLIKQCIVMEKHVIGICLGCQIIAHVMGCDIVSSNKLHLDYNTKILDFEYIFRCHKDYIIPNDKINVIASFDTMPYIIQSGKMYGIQCHPDIPSDYVIENLSHSKTVNVANKNRDIIEKNNQAMIDYLMDLIKHN